MGVGAEPLPFLFFLERYRRVFSTFIVCTAFNNLFTIHYDLISLFVFHQIGHHQGDIGIGHGLSLAFVHTRVGKDESSFDGGAWRPVVEQHGLPLNEEVGVVVFLRLHLLCSRRNIFEVQIFFGT